MAHELGGTFRQMADQAREFFAVIVAGDLKAGEMIRGAAAVLLEHAMKAAAQKAEPAAEGAARERHATRLQRKIEGPANPADVEFICQPGHRVENRRQKVRVLMRVEVRRPDAGGD